MAFLVSTIDIHTARFIEAYSKWQSLDTRLNHENEHPEGRLVFSQGCHVKLTNLTKTSMNGKEGVVMEYVPYKDRFSVEVDGVKCAIRAQNLILLDPQHESQLESDSGTGFKDKYAIPGMLFEGTICIPGDAGAEVSVANQDHPYFLNIMPPDDDWGVGDDCVMGRHLAYGDEQYVHISFKHKEDGSTTITFADGETLCEGTWDSALGELRGGVKQFTNSQDHVFVPSNEDTHHFTLKPSKTQFVEERMKVYEAFKSCLNELSELIEVGKDKNVDIINLIQNESRDNHLFPIQWNDLIDGLKLEAERICSLYRRGARVLNGMVFESTEDRSSKLSNFARPPACLSIIQAHQRRDALILQMNTLARGWVASSGRSLDDNIYSILVTIHIRLDNNFATFDTAMKKAQNRLTNKTLAQYEKIPAFSKSESDTSCAICLLPLGDTNDVEDRPLYLPCTHYFHRSCIRSWLLNNNQCPMCRLELTEN